MQEELRKLVQIKDYLRIIQKRKWLVIIFFSLLVVTGIVRAARMEPVYRVTAKLLIEREVPKVVEIQAVIAMEALWEDYYRTQYEVIKSRSLIREVIIEKKLWENPEFKGGGRTPSVIESVIGKIRHEITEVIQYLKTFFISLLKKIIIQSETTVKPKDNEPPRKENTTGGGIDPVRMSQLINSYTARLSVNPVPDTRLVNISFEGSYPELITDIINTHAKAYINQALKIKYEANKVAGEWLYKALEELKEKGKESDIALQKFKEKEDIVTLDSMMFSKSADQDSIIVQKISQLNTNLTTAKMGRLEAGAVYEQLKKVLNSPEQIETMPEIIQDTTIRTLKNDYISLIRQYSELSEKYGEKHPKIVSLKAEIDEQKNRIKIEIANLAKSIENQYIAAKEKEENLENALNEYKQEAQQLNRKAVEYGILNSAVEGNRALYEMIQKRLGQTTLTRGLDTSNISILDPAEVPLNPVRPNKKMYISLSAILGLMVGIGLALLFEYLDNTIKSPYDVDMYLRRLPLLGPIGSFSTLESELITVVNPESNFSEAFRNIRTNLLLKRSDNLHKTFLITSPERGEGKTLVSANLSIAMTQKNQKVLLIDANLRVPRLYSLFGVENFPGLSDLLKGEKTLDKVIKPTDIEGITLITAGKIPLDPSELLGSEAMMKLMEEVRNRFDFVVIDAPGILVAPDSAVISRLVDGVIILTLFGKTPRTFAQQAIDQLLNIHAKLSGIVINNVDYKKGRYHFPYYGWLLKDDSRIDIYSVERGGN